MPALHDAHPFQRLFDQEIEAAARLAQILDQEHAALAGNDPALLEQSVAEKHQMVARLDALGQQRMAALQTAGFSPDRDGVESCIHQSDPDSRRGLANSWERLHNLLEQCRRRNEANGRMLENSRRHIQAALATLQCQPLPTELYGRNGSASTDANSNSLAKA
jgi:flagella synthesis protein FlgN